MTHVTIVMPAYNVSRWIQQAIQSVLRQTHVDLNLIVMDDGSEDDTLESARHAIGHDARARIVEREHRGVCPTMHELWDMAEGPLLGQVDSDDMLVPAALIKCANVLNHDEATDYVYTQHSCIHPDGNHFGPGKSRPLSRSRGNTKVVAHHFRMFRKSAYEKVGPIDPTLPAMPDFDLALRLQRGCRGQFIEESLYLRRMHAGSLSASRQDLQQEAAKRLGLWP